MSHINPKNSRRKRGKQTIWIRLNDVTNVVFDRDRFFRNDFLNKLHYIYIHENERMREKRRKVMKYEYSIEDRKFPCRGWDEQCSKQSLRKLISTEETLLISRKKIIILFIEKKRRSEKSGRNSCPTSISVIVNYRQTLKKLIMSINMHRKDDYVLSKSWFSSLNEKKPCKRKFPLSMNLACSHHWIERI